MRFYDQKSYYVLDIIKYKERNQINYLNLHLENLKIKIKFLLCEFFF